MRTWEESKGERIGNFQLEKLPDGRTRIQNCGWYSSAPQVFLYDGVEHVLHQGDVLFFPVDSAHECK